MSVKPLSFSLILSSIFYSFRTSFPNRPLHCPDMDGNFPLIEEKQGLKRNLVDAEDS